MFFTFRRVKDRSKLVPCLIAIDLSKDVKIDETLTAEQRDKLVVLIDSFFMHFLTQTESSMESSSQDLIEREILHQDRRRKGPFVTVILCLIDDY